MGVDRHDGLAVPGRVELAREHGFHLGALHVDPPTRQVTGGGKRQSIEPRVMQVLVALVRAEGAVVSRDDLIECCWDGRIVGDDAINRVIGRIRTLASGSGNGSFEIETIPRVGYRLTSSVVQTPVEPSQHRTPSKVPVSKRALILGGAAAAAVAGAGLLIQYRRRHTPPPEAQELFRRGELAWKSALNDQVRQSVSFFERAVQIDPQYGQAWGALAVTYTHFLEGYDQAENRGLPAKIRAAAKRALELEPDNADAQLALSNIKPFFRNWAQCEREMRDICRRHPEHWLSHGRLAVLLYQVGRLSDGIEFHRHVLTIDQMVPLTHAFIIRALSNLGQIQDAEAAIQRAKQLFPAHPVLWRTEFFHLLFSGQPQAAIALVMDPRTRPSGMGQDEVDESLTLARAIDGRDPQDVAATIEPLRELASKDAGAIPFAAPLFSALGRHDLTVGSLQRYLLDRGNFGTPSPIGSSTRRYTDALFTTPLRPIIGDASVTDLMRATGLEAYWTETKSVPDYRRS